MPLSPRRTTLLDAPRCAAEKQLRDPPLLVPLSSQYRGPRRDEQDGHQEYWHCDWAQSAAPGKVSSVRRLSPASDAAVFASPDTTHLPSVSLPILATQRMKRAPATPWLIPMCRVVCVRSLSGTTSGSSPWRQMSCRAMSATCPSFVKRCLACRRRRCPRRAPPTATPRSPLSRPPARPCGRAPLSCPPRRDRL